MYIFGVDIGGTGIKSGIVDGTGKIVIKSSIPTQKECDYTVIVKNLADQLNALCADSGIALSEISAIGIGCPGAINSKKGVVDYSNNLRWTDVPLVDELHKYFDLPIKVSNDANVAALGEHVFGAGKRYNDTVMITLGTGVGGGIIIDNKVYSGFNYAGAELGHIVIEHNGQQCSCGRKGCWEAYSSATALIRMTNEKLEECAARSRKTLMAESKRVSGRTAFDCMRAGDEAAREVVDKYLAYLITGLVNIVNIFQPEVISIGGGVSGEGQSLVDALLDGVRREEYGHGVVPGTQIRIAQLGNDAGLVGAAVLGM